MPVTARILVVLLLACGCSRAPEGSQYELKGQILAIKPEQNEVLVKHEDIKGFMPTMTQHARTLKADPDVWHFLTATEPDELTSLASRFGITAERAPGDPVITHNVRTAVIDPEGKLVKAISGNSWTPVELVADLKAAPAPAH